MSRGRKPNGKGATLDWSYIFKKNAGKYFNIILSHLGSFRIIGDGQGIEVLNEIRKEKVKKKLKDKPFPKIKIDEIPYKIPENWIWCRLGEISINRDGERNPIALTDRNNREKIYDYYGASGIIDKIDGYTHEGELLLISEDGANLVSRSTPIAFIATGKYWVNNHAHVIETVHRVTLDYLKWYINSIDLKPFITGGFQPKLSQGNLNIIPVPLPPLSFQEKIIEFISDFENNNIKSNGCYFDSHIENKITKLHNSQLSASEMISENNFQLTQLKNLNQAILQEAVQGKLVKQDKKDELASELLKRIKADKTKSSKKENPLSPIKPEEIPFEIPHNWVWCKLGEIIEMVYGDSLTKAQCIEGAEYPVFGSNGIVGYYDKYLTAKRTIIVGRKGSAGALNICQTPSWTTDVAYYIEESDFLNFDFIYYLLKSLKLEELGKGIKPGVNRNEAYNILIPLPPLSEQKRIVSEIEKQLAKTKQLKEHIIANQQATEQLLKALLHQVFEVKEVEESVSKQSQVVEHKSSNVNFDELIVNAFEYFIPNPANNIQNINWELAMMVACIESKLGIGYGDVGLQKTVFNVSIKQPLFSKQYGFINSNFGTYSYELKDDLNTNPYLAKQNVKGKEVYAVSPRYQKQVLDQLTAPENKGFVQNLYRLLSVYEHPFINKETDKIELFNTVLKVALDTKSKDIEVIYKGMQNWKIKQEDFKTKAEKFSKSEAEKMLQLLVSKGY